jgi:hypothetical protein
MRGDLRLILILAAVCAARAAFAELPPPLTESPAPVEPAETKPEDFAYVAGTRPDRIGRVMVPVYVDGVGPFAFIVDTGASSSVLAPRVAARLKIPPDPSHSKLLRGITGSEVVPTVAVRSVKAGGIEITHAALPLVEPRVFADADGIFGADAFARGCLHINFEKASVSLFDKGCPRVGSNWEIVRMRLRFGGLPVVNARVGTVRVAAIIDTGAERSLGNPALLAALRARGVASADSTRTQVHAATSQVVFGDLVATPAVRMGSIEVGNLNPVFGPFEVFQMWGVADEPAIVLGMDVLGTAQALMLDYRRSEFRVLMAEDEDRIRQRNATPSRIPQ